MTFSHEIFCTPIMIIKSITEQKIKKIGGSMVNSPALTNDKKVKVAYCHDNEGNLIEIVEVL